MPCNLLLFRCGLLDTLDQGKLDNIDNIVFDVSASPRVRAEVLSFVMDHTEGFEEGDDDGTGADGAGSGEEDEATGSKSRKSSGSNGKAKVKRKAGDAEMAALTRKKRIAAQLETLLEFAELHLLHLNQSGGSLDLLVLLADACLSLPSRSGEFTTFSWIGFHCEVTIINDSSGYVKLASQLLPISCYGLCSVFCRLV
jgi:hypothetical protein